MLNRSPSRLKYANEPRDLTPAAGWGARGMQGMGSTEQWSGAKSETTACVGGPLARQAVGPRCPCPAAGVVEMNAL